MEAQEGPDKGRSILSWRKEKRVMLLSSSLWGGRNRLIGCSLDSRDGQEGKEGNLLDTGSPGPKEMA